MDHYLDLTPPNPDEMETALMECPEFPDPAAMLDRLNDMEARISRTVICCLMNMRFRHRDARRYPSMCLQDLSVLQAFRYVAQTLLPMSPARRRLRAIQEGKRQALIRAFMAQSQEVAHA